MGATRTVIHDKSLKRFRKEVRRITARSRGRSVRQIIGELNDYLQGWKPYYQVGVSKTRGNAINAWILRRLRAYIWEQWKLPRTKVTNLKKLGLWHESAKNLGNTRIRLRMKLRRDMRGRGASSNTATSYTSCRKNCSLSTTVWFYLDESPALNSRLAGYAIRTSGGVGGLPRVGSPIPMGSIRVESDLPGLGR